MLFFLLSTFSQAQTLTTCVAEFDVIKSGVESHVQCNYICNENIIPPGGFNEDTKYTCYNKNADIIRVTQGGCSGYLLHSKLKETYKSGNNYVECNFYYGLLDGIFTKWNEDGTILIREQWDKGKLVKTIIDNTRKVKKFSPSSPN